MFWDCNDGENTREVGGFVVGQEGSKNLVDIHLVHPKLVSLSKFSSEVNTPESPDHPFDTLSASHKPDPFT